MERVRSALLGLCEPLHDAFTWAEQLRRERLPELSTGPAYRWHATHTVRALAHYRLCQASGELGGWKLSGNHSQNGALWLTDGSYRARILHTLDECDVPPPGANCARRAFYRNPPLLDELPLFGEANDKLLMLWNITSTSAVVSFRVVRPIGNWAWGTHAKTDLDFPLPQTAEELADLAFEPSDEDLALELPSEEEEGEGDNDASGIPG
ncbi:MAG: hypothetical protein M3Q75_03145 [Gemmatimonadota bacterium]|nr:hypothetical protein [Gemmatimonadota bacterium]